MPARSIHVSRLKATRFSRVLLRPVLPELRGSRVTVVHETLPPRSELPAVMHRRTTELVFCIRGDLTAVLDGRRRRVRPGTFLWIPPGVWHRFISGRQTVECLSIFSPPLRLRPGADVVTR